MIYHIGNVPASDVPNQANSLLAAILAGRAIGRPLYPNGSFGSAMTLPSIITKHFEQSKEFLPVMAQPFDPTSEGGVALDSITSVLTLSQSVIAPPPSVGTFNASIEDYYFGAIYPTPGYHHVQHAIPGYIFHTAGVVGKVSIGREDKVVEQFNCESNGLYLYIPYREILAPMNSVSGSWVDTSVNPSLSYGANIPVSNKINKAGRQLVVDIIGNCPPCTSDTCPSDSFHSNSVFTQYQIDGANPEDVEIITSDCCIPCNTQLSKSTRFVVHVDSNVSGDPLSQTEPTCLMLLIPHQLINQITII